MPRLGALPGTKKGRLAAQVGVVPVSRADGMWKGIVRAQVVGLALAASHSYLPQWVVTYQGRKQ
jgi:hypothetical protein